MSQPQKAKCAEAGCTRHVGALSDLASHSLAAFGRRIASTKAKPGRMGSSKKDQDSLPCIIHAKFWQGGSLPIQPARQGAHGILVKRYI